MSVQQHVYPQEAGSVAEPPQGERITVEPVIKGRVGLPDNFRALVPLVVVIVGVCVFATIESDEFLTLSNFQNIFAQVVVMGILAIGATMLMIAGQFDLSVGSGVALLSIVGAKLVGDGVSELVIVAILMAAGAIIGLTAGAIVTATGAHSFIVTLGGLSVLAGLALIVSDQQPIAIGQAFSSVTLTKWGPLPVTVVVFVGLALLGGILLRVTVLGRSTYAIGSNEEAARLAGVRITTTKLALFAINGVLVGVAGVMLLARLGSGDPTAGAGLELQAITAVVLGGASLGGGRGTVLGTFLGVLLLGVISNALAIVGISNAYAQVIFGAVLIVAVIWAAFGEMKRRSAGPFRRRAAAAMSRARHDRRDERAHSETAD